MVGAATVTGLVKQSDGSLDKGRIYDPKPNMEYDLKIETLSAELLDVTVYIAGQTRHPPTVANWARTTETGIRR